MKQNDTTFYESQPTWCPRRFVDLDNLGDVASPVVNVDFGQQDRKLQSAVANFTLPFKMHFFGRLTDQIKIFPDGFISTGYSL